MPLIEGYLRLTHREYNAFLGTLALVRGVLAR